MLFYDVADHVESRPSARSSPCSASSASRRRAPRTARSTTCSRSTGSTPAASAPSSTTRSTAWSCASTRSHAQALLGEVNHRPRGAVAFKFASPAKVTKVARHHLGHRAERARHAGRDRRAGRARGRDGAARLAPQRRQRARARHRRRRRGARLAPQRRHPLRRGGRREEAAPAAEAPTDLPASAARRSSSRASTCVCRNTDVPRARRGPDPELDRRDRRARVGRQAHRAARRGASSCKRAGRSLRARRSSDIAALERRGEKIAKKCLDKLDAELPLTLPGLPRRARDGELRAPDRAAPRRRPGYDSLEKMLAATEEELAAIAGLGPIKAASIVRGLALARGRDPAPARRPGVVPVAPEQQGPLAGLTFCFTGASSTPRAELTQLVESNGGRVLAARDEGARLPGDRRSRVDVEQGGEGAQVRDEAHHRGRAHPTRLRSPKDVLILGDAEHVDRARAGRGRRGAIVPA